MPCERVVLGLGSWGNQTGWSSGAHLARPRWQSDREYLPPGEHGLV